MTDDIIRKSTTPIITPPCKGANYSNPDIRDDCKIQNFSFLTLDFHRDFDLPDTLLICDWGKVIAGNNFLCVTGS